MAIEKALPGSGEPDDGSVEEIEIEIVNPESVSVETPDGGVVIDFDPDANEDDIEFGANLAEHLDDSELGSITSDVVGAFEADRTHEASGKKLTLRVLIFWV